MSLSCTRCESTGFLNLHQIPELNMEEIQKAPDFCNAVLKWIDNNTEHDVTVCDCCGNGEGWYGIPGEHYNPVDQPGMNGPYYYNGGLCQCH